MPRMLARAGILVALLATPALALAAYTDVTLTTDTVLTVNGITLNVSGSSAVIESITVNATDFSVSLPASANLQVTAPGLEKLSVSTSFGMTSFTCSSSQSIVGYAPTTDVTVTITPSTTELCTSGSGSGGGSGGGGGGGGSTTTTVTTPVTTTVTTPVTPTPTTTTTTTTTSSSGLSSAQIQSILDVLVSFDADASVIEKVRASLQGTTQGSVTSAAVHVFKANLTVGSLGSEVKALQEYLNAHGYTIANNGAGSPGNETTKFGALTKAALIKFQKAKGITPAVGYFGAKTRAAIEAGS